MKSALRPALVIALAALGLAALFAALPTPRADAGSKLRHRLQSGALPFEDGDQVRVVLTNTTNKQQRAVIVVQRVGVNGQLDAIAVEARTLEARTVAEHTQSLNEQGGMPLHMVEVLSGNPGVVATTQFLRAATEVPGRGLAVNDFVRTKGRFADPSE